MRIREALATSTDPTGGVALHGLADEVGQVPLVEAGKPSETYVLGVFW